MKLVVPLAPLRRVLRWTRRGLLALGISLLGYTGFVLLDTWSFQREAGEQLDRLLARQPQEAVAARPASSPAPPVPPQAEPGGLMGRIEIPRIGISAIVMEGTAAKTLRRAVGHISGTGMPGQPGNVGVSGHRDTFFRPLRNIRVDDVITLVTPAGEYRYRVDSIKIVRPQDMSVLASNSDEILTLVTCYPFYYVGPAPSRFIVRAARIA